MERTLDIGQKAFDINLDPSIYGTLAEIGAGQEVSRRFFRAGGAAGTVAKSMSAYDMTVSDAIYGPSGRYVSRERLEKMMEHESRQLIERLDAQRGEETKFFVFADTVAAKAFKDSGECHGWMGVSFQHEPRAPFSQMLIHMRMLDQINLQQQEALGILGTNLIYNCFRKRGDRVSFVKGLMGGLSTDRILIDYVDVLGPGFEGQDPRLWSLELVKQGYTEAVLFGPDGRVLSAKDKFYKKKLLLSRGSYRPPSHFNMDMLEKGRALFCQKIGENYCGDNLVVVPEISMSEFRERGKVISEDFLTRVNLLGKLGHHCLISSYNTYGELSRYLSNYTSENIAFILTPFNLEDIFNEKKYADHPSGLLGGLGALFGHQTNLFVYPSFEELKGEKGGRVLLSNQAQLAPEVRPLLDWLRLRGRLEDIVDYDQHSFKIWSRTVLRMIQKGEKGWEKMVPEIVAKEIKKKGLFDYPLVREGR